MPQFAAFFVFYKKGIWWKVAIKVFEEINVFVSWERFMLDNCKWNFWGTEFILFFKRGIWYRVCINLCENIDLTLMIKPWKISNLFKPNAICSKTFMMVITLSQKHFKSTKTFHSNQKQKLQTKTGGGRY